MSLLDRRIVIVTGKGGVGKTTVCAALGLEAARRGLRTIVAETSGSERLPALFGKKGRGYELSELAPDLYTLSITPHAAMEDYIIQQVKVRKIYQMVFQNRVMGPFIEGVPGLHDAVQLGKVYNLERERRLGRSSWDLILVNAPATGHGLSLLSSAKTMMDLTRAGPLYEGVREVHEVLDDPARTGIVLVSLPEEMPVNETCELYQRLGESRQRVGLVVLNEVMPPPFSPGPDWETARAALVATAHPGVQEAVDLAEAQLERVRRQDAAREALRTRIQVPQVDLPFTLERDRLTGDIGQQALLELGLRLGAAIDGAGHNNAGHQKGARP